MVATSSGNTMCDQVLGGKPRNIYIQRTRRQGHQVRRTRRRAATEAIGTGRPTQPGHSTPEGHASTGNSGLRKLQQPDVRPGPDVRQLPGFGRPSPSGTESTDVLGRPGDRATGNRTKTMEVQRPTDVRTVPSLQTSDAQRTSDPWLRPVAG